MSTDTIIDRWFAAYPPARPGASAADLARLEQVVGAPLPSEVRAFYARSDGMPDCDYDQHQVSFWSIARIVSESQDYPSGRVAFADFLIHSWYFYFTIVDGSVRVGSANFDRLIGDFREFLDQYLTDPASLGVL